MPGSPATRASDAERDDAVARLRTAAGEGRLTLDEFADRVDRVLAATERAQLQEVTADLPEAAAATPRVPDRAARGSRWIVAILGGCSRRGRWRVASRCTVINVMGGSDLDLSDAVVEDAQTVIRVISIAGGATIVVPPGVHVELGGFAFMGGNDLRLEGAPAPAPEAPVVRVQAYSIMGGTDVKLRKGAARAGLRA